MLWHLVLPCARFIECTLPLRAAGNIRANRARSRRLGLPYPTPSHRWPQPSRRGGAPGTGELPGSGPGRHEPGRYFATTD
jgi:hypothetical protein